MSYPDSFFFPCILHPVCIVLVTNAVVNLHNFLYFSIGIVI
ncbi:hypothetical protein SUBVAR_04256 [Subdoligranulum variabile DSM 15176]|uniref:Uncharacterized protein n=1 Tax=Subdoligranulum variabile DSM 15176 TaxID=411471 RepID=D1PIU0_9FIRM|nr:hypothetical protein SUBVAR_04256 [Subdoligranulum variabile DSM 15176]